MIDEEQRAYSLAGIVPFLPPDLYGNAQILAGKIKRSVLYAHVLLAMYPYASSDTQKSLLEKSIEAMSLPREIPPGNNILKLWLCFPMGVF